MTKKELELEVKKYIKNTGILTGDFEIVGFKTYSSNKYKLKLALDLKLEGYGDEGADIDSQNWEGAVKDIAYFLEGSWDKKEGWIC